MLFRDRNKLSLPPEVIKRSLTKLTHEQARPLTAKHYREEQMSLNDENHRLQAENEQLRQEMLYHKRAYQIAPIGLIVFSNAGLLIDMNQSASKCLGISVEEYESRDFRECLDLASQEIFDEHISLCMKSQKPVINEIFVVNSRGGSTRATLESISWKNAEGEACYILSQVKGMKEIEPLFSTLVKDSAGLTSENRVEAKRQLFAQVAHGLRTPLGVMIGFTDLLLERQNIDDDLFQGLSIIHRNGFGLLSLIDDLLDLAKLEAGSMNMENSEFIVEAEIQKILTELTAKAQDKGISLQYEALTPLPPKIMTDPSRFRQILMSIVGNAIKYTDHGLVKVLVSLVPKTLQEDPGSYLHVDVIDTGCGISSDQFTQVFQPFSTGESRSLTSNGLGLSLARRLGEGLGGGVQLLRSEIGLGSTFRITIDPQVEINAIRVGESQASSDTKDSLGEKALLVDIGALQGLKVLVVEDGEDNRLILSRLLKKAGAVVECVENGEEAIQAVANHSYDAILMDIQMPHMDGYTVTTRLRMQGCKTPIIALTAHTQIEDRVKAQRAGFDDFLSKPIDRDKLVSTLASYQDDPLKPALH